MPASTQPSANQEYEPPIALLSDIGGIIVEAQWPVAAALISKETGASPERVRKALSPGVRALDLGEQDLHEFYRDFLGRAKLVSPSWRRFNRIVLDESLLLIPRNVLLYRTLHNEHAMRIIGITNVGAEISAALESKHRLSSLFDSMIRSFEVGALKPSELVFREALRRAGAGAGATRFVDDSRENVKAARMLGIPSALVQRPQRLRLALANLGVGPSQVVHLRAATATS